MEPLLLDGSQQNKAFTLILHASVRDSTSNKQTTATTVSDRKEFL